MRALLATATVLLLLAVEAQAQYKLIENRYSNTTLRAVLNYTGSNDTYIKKTNPIIKQLSVTVHVHTYYDFYVKITDKD
jgi:hypothetical protein